MANSENALLTPITWYVHKHGLIELLPIMVLERDHFIEKAYETIFKRKIDESGLKHFQSYFERGLGPEYILSDMLSSDEAKNIYSYQDANRVFGGSLEETNNLKNEILALRRSFSWRITLPLRIFTTLIRYVFKFWIYLFTDPGKILPSAISAIASAIRHNDWLRRKCVIMFEKLPFDLQKRLFAMVERPKNSLAISNPILNNYSDLDSQTLWILGSFHSYEKFEK